jgi:solute carrier family 25, member 34/35
VRGFLGAGTQLPAYTIFKDQMEQSGYSKDSIFTHILCSAASAGRIYHSLPSQNVFLGVSILFCNPADVVRTRIYNQPFDPSTGKGLLYRNGLDALTKIVRTEGVLGGLYKGAWTHYSRLGPHIVLVFVFLEQMKKGI